jgi:hypothetical protein
MLEEQLSSLLIILKEDAVLRNKLHGDDEFYKATQLSGRQNSP